MFVSASQANTGPNVKFISEIICEAPFVPKNGAARLRRKSYVDSTVMFTCDPGYVLEGPKVLRCQENGMWNGTEPECKGFE